MKLYLAFKGSQILLEGYSEQVGGVFSTEEAAWAYLSTTSDFEWSEQKRPGVGRVYHFDGELSYYWSVIEMELDKPLHKDL